MPIFSDMNIKKIIPTRLCLFANCVEFRLKTSSVSALCSLLLCETVKKEHINTFFFIFYIAFSLPNLGSVILHAERCVAGDSGRAGERTLRADHYRC